jgi:glycine C-acetyltransferase
VAKEDIINVVRHKGRPYVYSNSSSPSVIGATIEIFNMLEENTDMIDSLRENTKLFKRSLKEAGFKVLGHQEVPIACIQVGDDAMTRKFSNELVERFNINIRVVM